MLDKVAWYYDYVPTLILRVFILVANLYRTSNDIKLSGSPFQTECQANCQRLLHNVGKYRIKVDAITPTVFVKLMDMQIVGFEVVIVKTQTSNLFLLSGMVVKWYCSRILCFVRYSYRL